MGHLLRGFRMVAVARIRSASRVQIVRSIDRDSSSSVGRVLQMLRISRKRADPFDILNLDCGVCQRGAWRIEFLFTPPYLHLYLINCLEHQTQGFTIHVFTIQLIKLIAAN